jgi:hypothetical protein
MTNTHISDAVRYDLTRRVLAALATNPPSDPEKEAALIVEVVIERLLDVGIVREVEGNDGRS